MSRPTRRRDRYDFPKMKLRGKRYRDRMTTSEKWQAAGRAALRGIGRLKPAISGLGKAASEVQPAMQEFGDALQAPTTPNYPTPTNPNQSRRTS